MNNQLLTIWTDGGARGNPGPAGIGVIIESHGRVIKKIKRAIGETTNNVAEYQAVIAGLEAARDLGAKKVICRLDSQLVVEQLNQRYKVKNANIGALFLKAWNITREIGRVEFQYIPREKNTRADWLVNEAIDEAMRNKVV